MSEDTYEARLLAGQVLLVPGVRKGILRKPGTLILTRGKLLFLPEAGAAGEAVEKLAACEEDAAVGDALDAAIAAAKDSPHALELARGAPGLAPPDDEGRLRLLALGEEDDLLVPPPAVGLVALVMGPRGTAQAPTAASPVFAQPAMAAAAPPPVFAAAAPGEEIPGWIGPISGGVGALLSLIGLPLLVLASVMLVEEVDDELGAVVFLLGAAVLTLTHLGTFVSAGFGFVRRETTRLWGLSTLAFAGLTFMILMVGSLVALEELF
jgi:hypothetical protein